MMMTTALEHGRIRRQFPVMEKLLYLDAAHQTPLSIAVRARLDAFYDEAQYSGGPKARWLVVVEETRARLAGLIGMDTDETAFVKNTSEGLNAVASGLAWNPGDNVVLLASEHPNNAYAWLHRRPAGLEVRQVPDDKRWADASTFAPFVDARTRAIAVSHVMFHSGQRNDVDGIAALAHSFGAVVVLDAMQSVGVFPVPSHHPGIAAICGGSHKGLLTPHGLGFLATAAPAAVLTPTYVGPAGVANARGDMIAGTAPVLLRPDARRFEIGNVNIAAVHALAGSLDLIESIGLPAISEHVLALGDRLIAHLDRLHIDLIGPREREHRSHIYVLSLTGAAWPAYLNEAGVRCSPVRDGLRVSFGIYNTADDIDRLADIVEGGLLTKGLDRQPARTSPHP